MLVILPAVGPSTVPFGCPRFTWLKALNSSARNCAPTLSVIWKFLFSEASALKVRGPKNELRATFPKVPAAGLLHGPRVQPLRFNSAVGAEELAQPVPEVPTVAVA